MFIVGIVLCEDFLNSNSPSVVQVWCGPLGFDQSRRIKIKVFIQPFAYAQIVLPQVRMQWALMT